MAGAARGCLGAAPERTLRGDLRVWARGPVAVDVGAKAGLVLSRRDACRGWTLCERTEDHRRRSGDGAAIRVPDMPGAVPCRGREMALTAGVGFAEERATEHVEAMRPGVREDPWHVVQLVGCSA